MPREFVTYGIIAGYPLMAFLLTIRWAQDRRRAWQPTLKNPIMALLLLTTAARRLAIVLEWSAPTQAGPPSHWNTGSIWDLITLTIVTTYCVYAIRYRTAGETRLVSELNEIKAKYQLLTEEGNTERVRMNQIREHLISVAAHELRTPITVIIGFAQLLMRQQKGAPNKLVARIVTEARQLEDLVTMLLEVDQTNMGLVACTRESMDLRTLVDDAIERITVSNDLPEGRIACGLPEAPVMGRWDKIKVGQVLINVLDNAIKYSPDNTVVTVEMHPTDAAVLIVVRDHGIGITESERLQLFKPFTRSPRAQENANGLGIGLAIVKTFVELHKGTVDVQSTIGKGTDVLISLPYHE